MKFSYLFTVLAFCSAASTTKVCPAILRQKPAPSSKCGQTYGKVLYPQILGSGYSPVVAGHINTCRDICAQNTACQSFSYTVPSNLCLFYSADVNKMGFIPENSASYPVFWSENCFTVPVSCPAASSTSVPALPSKTVSSSVSKLSVSSPAPKSTSTTGPSSKLTSTTSTTKSTTITVIAIAPATTSTTGSLLKSTSTTSSKALSTSTTVVLVSTTISSANTATGSKPSSSKSTTTYMTTSSTITSSTTTSVAPSSSSTTSSTTSSAITSVAPTSSSTPSPISTTTISTTIPATTSSTTTSIAPTTSSTISSTFSPTSTTTTSTTIPATTSTTPTTYTSTSSTPTSLTSTTATSISSTLNSPQSTTSISSSFIDPETDLASQTSTYTSSASISSISTSLESATPTLVSLPTSLSSTTSTIESSPTTLGANFAATYTFTEHTLPTFTTPPASVQGPASTDVPAPPMPSPICLINPDDITSTFSILTPNFAYIIPKSGTITVIQDSDLPTDISEVGFTPPIYYFQKSLIAGAYDLLGNGTGSFLYVGFDTTTGSVITSAASSGASGNYVTSVFSISCEGQISINLQGIAYIWQVAANGIDTTISQGAQTKVNTMNAVPQTPSSSVATSRRRKRINYEGGAAPRCPNNPPGLLAYVAGNARPAESHGCGSGATSSLVSVDSFGSCCNNHDLCYDNCVGGDFEDCNTDFYNCMNDVCSGIPSGRRVFDTKTCYGARDSYSAKVKGVLGQNTFSQDNYFDVNVANQNPENTGRCSCACPAGSTYCNANCVNYQSDNQNCGGCGIQCTGSNVCVNSQCSCPFNTLIDSNNCGACGIQCPAWAVCKGGQCVCPGDTCGNLCVDFQNHPRNCGGCGNVCSSGYCNGGQCVTPPADVCFPGDVISNGGFDNSDANTPWMFNPASSVNGAGFDGGADSVPNSCVLDYLGADVSVFQNIALCPSTKYQLSFHARVLPPSKSIKGGSSSSVAKTCSWNARVAGQTLGNGTVSSATPSWQPFGPLYMAALNPGIGTGTPGSADSTTYQYDMNGIQAYTQLAITVSCGSTPTVFRIDSISLYPVA